jgi:hypothetical protein
MGGDNTMPRPSDAMAAEVESANRPHVVARARWFIGEGVRTDTGHISEHDVSRSVIAMDAEIARLRTALATAERRIDDMRQMYWTLMEQSQVTFGLLTAERDQAQADDQRTAEILANAHYEHIKRAAEVSTLTADRDTARAEASWALLHLSRIAVAAGLTKDENSASAPEEVLRAVEGVVASLASTRAALEAAMVVVEAAQCQRESRRGTLGIVRVDAWRAAWGRWDTDAALTEAAVDAFRSRTKETTPP